MKWLKDFSLFFEENLRNDKTNFRDYIYIYSNWAKCLNVLGYDANSLRLWHAGLKVSYETWNYLKLNEKGFQQKK